MRFVTALSGMAMVADVRAVTRPLASMVTTGTVVALPVGPVAEPMAVDSGVV